MEFMVLKKQQNILRITFARKIKRNGMKKKFILSQIMEKPKGDVKLYVE